MKKHYPSIFYGLCCVLVAATLYWNDTSLTGIGPAPKPATTIQTDSGTYPPSSSDTTVSPPNQTPPQTVAQTLVNDIPKEPTTAVAEASPRSERYGFRSDESIEKDGHVFPLRTYQTQLTPNDPSYNQWWITSNGMTSVWDIPSNAPQTTVAVIDTGFALGHQEFTGRWATNTGEFGSTATEGASRLNCTDRGLALNRSCNNIDDNYDGIVDNESGTTSREHTSSRNCTDQGLPLNKNCNMLDDDANGYVDDYTGYDFVNFNRSVQAGETNANGTGTTHGTMVAGVLGATGNNGVGIAGVNWHTKILPLQALNDDSYGDSYTVAEAVYYAADRGVTVISLSLGTSADDPYLRQAILYALDRGILIVAASGNDGCNCISYPANYPEVIAVGAVGSDGNRASFSNYGANLDISAPGQSITTSYFTAANQTSAYATAGGTSLATPFVSGVFALARMSQPNAAWEEIIGTMFEASDRRGATAASPHSTTLGFGVSRASSMLDRLRAPSNSILRHQFSGGTILGSMRSYECVSGVVPATRYYELRKNGLINYTANLRELSRSVQTGWTSRQVTTTCIGLPTDSVSTIKLVDLPSETLNLRLKQ